MDAATIAGAKRTAQAGVNATNRKPGIPEKTRKKTTGIEREVDQIVPKRPVSAHQKGRLVQTGAVRGHPSLECLVPWRRQPARPRPR